MTQFKIQNGFDTDKREVASTNTFNLSKIQPPPDATG